MKWCTVCALGHKRAKGQGKKALWHASGGSLQTALAASFLHLLPVLSNCAKQPLCFFLACGRVRLGCLRDALFTCFLNIALCPALFCFYLDGRQPAASSRHKTPSFLGLPFCATAHATSSRPGASTLQRIRADYLVFAF